MKNKLFDKAIDWAKRNGFSNIKANTDEFQTPASLTSVNDEQVIIPDMTVDRNGIKSYVEIAVKEDDKRSLVSKWKLLCTLASLKGGKLYLLAGRGNKAFTDQIVKTHKLHNVSVVSI